MLLALGWKALIYFLPATSQQFRYHGDRISHSFCEHNSRTALLVSKIIFHIHVLRANDRNICFCDNSASVHTCKFKFVPFVEYNSSDFLETTKNRTQINTISGKLKEKLLTSVFYFNFRSANRP